jgi:serine/threonine protein kinase
MEYGRGTFQISDFGSGKIYTYRSDSDKTQSLNGTLTYEPPEARLEGLTSRPYDIWSLGCVFLELLIWAVVDTESVEEFASQRVGRRYSDSRIDIVIDDAFWQMAEDGKATLRGSVDCWIGILKARISQQRPRPFKEVLELVIQMLDPNRRTRIMALRLSDALDDIYKQSKIDLSKSDLAEYGRLCGPIARPFVNSTKSYFPNPRLDTSPLSPSTTGYANESYFTASPAKNFSSRYPTGQ